MCIEQSHPGVGVRTSRGAAGSRSAPGRTGFTLIELLVSIAIIAVLVSLVVPGIGRTMTAARAFKCQMSQRSVAFDFQVFADRQLHGDRGDDRDLGADRFRLETFQDSQYGLDEFWAYPGQTRVSLPDASGRDPMRCAEVRGDIAISRDSPCTSSGAIDPPQRISFGFNLRLHRSDAGFVRLDSGILDRRDGMAGRIPLLWDVDGEAAMERGVVPVFSAPALGGTGFLANDRYWFPAFRHGGAANFAFVDGSVDSSSRPLDEPDWDWAYQPR